MLPERLLIGQSVRSLQVMLREISFVHPDIPAVIPDGVFEEETRRTVLAFQRHFGMEETGVVNNEVWDAIVVVYRQSIALTHQPLRCAVYPAPDYTIPPGSATIHMYAIQSMFKSLSHLLQGVQDAPVDGRHTGASVQNVRWLQRRGGLPENGVMDMQSWELLSRLYCLYITRNPQVK